jgi:hypothetical protein
MIIASQQQFDQLALDPFDSSVLNTQHPVEALRSTVSNPEYSTDGPKLHQDKPTATVSLSPPAQYLYPNKKNLRMDLHQLGVNESAFEEGTQEMSTVIMVCNIPLINALMGLTSV